MINKQDQRIEQLERVLFLQQGKIEQLNLRVSNLSQRIGDLQQNANHSEAKNV